MSIDNTFSSTTAPRPVPASSDLHRWDLLEILNPPLSPPTRSRGRKMSLDFSTKAPQSLYGQSDIDQSFNVPNSENASILFCFVSFLVAHHEFQTEGMDTTDHPSYEIFSGSASNSSLSSQAYRTNASSSSSLGHGYGMNSDNIYNHPPFNDSVPSYAGSNSSNPFDIMGAGMPSSYNSGSSGKVSPLTPNDPVGGFNPPPDFPLSLGPKEFQPNYPDIERRSSGASYNPPFDEYCMNSGINYPSNGFQPYQERLGRFPPEHRYSHPGPVPPAVSHMPPSIPPHATHGMPYDGLSHYQSDPHQEMSLRAPSVDETLARMRLHPIMGQSNDLQTFIR